MSTPDTVSKTDRAYAVVKGRILDHTYGPGYRIVVDQLARETGLSNIPLREAIRRLEAEGLLEIVRNVGARVAMHNVEDHRYTMQLLARLEGLATALALPHLTSEDLAEARDANLRMRKALEQFDPTGFMELNRTFHGALLRRCPDAHLLVLLAAEQQRLDVIRRDLRSMVPGRAASSLDEHDALLAMIEARAGADDVEAAARRHKVNGLGPRVATDA